MAAHEIGSRTYKDQCASSGPRGNRRKDRSKEHRNEKANAACHGRQTRLAAFGDASSGFNESSHGRRAEERTHGDAERIGAVSKCRPGEVPVSGSTTPANRAILYNVAVQSMMSLYVPLLAADQSKSGSNLQLTRRGK